MGILDKIQKKSEKIEKEKKSETVIPSDTKLKPIEPHPTINKKATVGNDETILDTYSIKIDEIEMEVVIKREEGYIYYLVPEIDKINMSLSKLTKDQQEVVILRYGANMKLNEIAKMKNKSDVAIRALLFRAIHSLKEMLLKEVHESE